MMKLLSLFSFVLVAVLVESFSSRITRESENFLRSTYLMDSISNNYFLVDNTKNTKVNLRESSFNRIKRATTEPNPMINAVNLNDSHSMVLVSWAGEGSDVIIALARDPIVIFGYSSNLYLSHDYGRTFRKQVLMLENGSEGSIYWFYVSPVMNNRFVFTDLIHKTIWTTSDSGKTFTRHTLSFSPLLVTFHPYEWQTMAIFEGKGASFDIHISLNFGLTWRQVHNGAKNFFWGSQRHGDNASDVYIHDAATWMAMKYNYRSQRTVRLVSNVESFQRTNEFLMAIKKVYKPLLSANVSELWVSTNNLDFRRAVMPGYDYYKEMYVADASEHQIFLCASINSTDQINLFTSDIRGHLFSLSLEGMIYYNPNGINNKTWLRTYISRQFVDMHKIEGLNGIYIATKLVNSSAPLTFNSDSDHVTMITFNKGGDWRYLPSPSTRANFYCLFNPSCNLHLAQLYHSIVRPFSLRPILSSPSFPGLLIASGNTGSAINNSYDTFISTNGGLSWRNVLNGTYIFAIGDHGGIIVGIQMTDLTNHIIYSLDEGHSWSALEFIDSKIQVYGLFTEPGEETGIFTLFGSYPDRHVWIIFQLNLTKLFDRNCTDSDYTTWTPTGDPKIDCLLGRKMSFEKRLTFSVCYNGRNYDRAVSVESCPCKIEDYECDFGFAKNSTTKLCQQVQTPLNPIGCYDGGFYNRTRGYRKVPMDTCEGGMQDDFDPIPSNCPVRVMGEFLMFSNMTSIHRYSFSTRQTTKIQARNIDSVIAMAYDYKEDCLYFADNKLDNIQVMCLRGPTWGSNQRVLLAENMDQIESLTFNWVTKQLFWVDSGHKRVESLSIKNNKRIVLMTNLDQPKSLAIHPRMGYMFISDWSEADPRIMRVTMIGSDRLVVVNRSKMPSLKWPNGLAVDGSTSRIFFVDAGVDVLHHCSFEGGSCVAVQLTAGAHPFSTAIFKQNVMWADPMAGSVYSASKERGGASVKLITGFENVVDVIAFSVNSQGDSSACSGNPCRDANAFCFEVNVTSWRCKCPQEFVENNLNEVDVVCMCPNGTVVSENSCVVSSGSTKCPQDLFTCGDLRCIPMESICNGNRDCLDGSDEWNCTLPCPSDQFRCRNSVRCINLRWVCDGDNDCGDMSDESTESCNIPGRCSSTEFHCNSGRCIRRSYVCDGDDDCRDGSDEANCSYATTTVRPPIQCTGLEFKCLSGEKCIPASFRCDNDYDCLDRSDEQNCTFNSNCSSFHTPCRTGNQCVLLWRICDGNSDCDDGSDEQDCRFNASTTYSPTMPSHCSPEEFQCRSSQRIQCIPMHEVCDGIPNCLDQSDESSCSHCLPPSFRCQNGACVSRNLVCNGYDDCGDSSDEENCRVTQTPPIVCPSPSVRCVVDDHCIPEAWICDGEKDCADGADEVGCPNATMSCGENTFSCIFSKFCINESLVCNGREDCPGGSDEMNCETRPTPTCAPTDFKCKLGGCVDPSVVCDGRWNCVDASDENCFYNLKTIPILMPLSATDTTITFQVTGLNDSLVGDGGRFNLVVSIGTPDLSFYHVNNSLTSISQSQLPLNITLKKLRPNTMYVITSSIVVANTLSLPVSLSVATLTRTIPQPGPPLNVTTLNLRNDTYLLVLSWSPPANIDPGDVKAYKIMYRDITNNDDVTISKSLEIMQTSYTFCDNELILGRTYSFQVFALTLRWSEGSKIKGARFGVECIDVEAMRYPYQGVTSFLFNVEDSPVEYSEDYFLRWNFSLSGLDVYTYTVVAACLVDFGNDLVGNDDVDVDGDSKFKVFKAEEALNEDCRKGSNCLVHMRGLSPSSTYLFRLTAEAKDMSIHPTCVDKQLVAETLGYKLETPSIKISQQQDGSINLKFVHKNDERTLPLSSEVRVKVLHRNINQPKLESMAFEFRASRNKEYNLGLGRLPPCETYCFFAMFTWPRRSYASIPDCISVVDAKDNLEPPKFVQILSWSLNENKTSVSFNIGWSPPCLPQPMAYLIHIQLFDHDRAILSNGFSMNDPEGLTFLTYEVKGLQRGNHYRISLKKDIPGARMSKVMEFFAEPYPSPRNLTAELLEGSGTSLVLSWEKPIGELPSEYEYEVYHSDDFLMSRDQSSFAFLERTEQLFIIVPEKLRVDLDHSFKVRLRCPGTETKSNFSNIVNIRLPGKPLSDESQQRKSEWKIVVYMVVSAAGICILSLLVVYVYRYHKLRRTFNSYVNTRFDSESNRAIFTQLADDDDDDQPLINRFSDDDPLIEA